jgi:Uma2 family endonuclease
MSNPNQNFDMTVEEFLIWNSSKVGRFELVDGSPVLREYPGATYNHDEIVVNIVGSLRKKLRATCYVPHMADAAVRTGNKRVRRPDVSIASNPTTADPREVFDPIVVFEVFSPTPRILDRQVKYGEYSRHQTIRMIVSIDPDHVDVVVTARDAAGAWTDRRLEKLSDSFFIPTTAFELTLAEVYADLPFGQEMTT